MILVVGIRYFWLKVVFKIDSSTSDVYSVGRNIGSRGLLIAHKHK